jgi:pyrimidine deaminase RibD-like protein
VEPHHPSTYPFAWKRQSCPGCALPSLPARIGKREKNIQRQPSHRCGGIELLGDRDKADALLIELLDDLGKVCQRACQPVDLVDYDGIFLTEAGADLAQPALDREFCVLAVAEARKSIPEDDGESHPCVGAVVVKDGAVLAKAYRGETDKGRHAEFCALKKMNDDVDLVDLSGCTVYTTLEPCSKRNSPNKTACATRLINASVSRVVYGMADKDESVYGHVSLTEANINVGLFPRDLIQELIAINKNRSDTRRQSDSPPPPNHTSSLAMVSYYKPGTSMAENIHLYVRPPKDNGGPFTVEDAANKVLAWGQTLQEIAVKWHQIDDQKVIVQGLWRQGIGSSHPLLALK